MQVVFKSSPMGTRSHGNAANNSFVLWAYGQRLLTPHRPLLPVRRPASSRLGVEHAVAEQHHGRRPGPGQAIGLGQGRNRRLSDDADDRRGRRRSGRGLPRRRIRQTAPAAGPVHPRHPVRQAGTGDRLRPVAGRRASTLRVLAARDQRDSSRRPAGHPGRSRATSCARSTS